MTIYVIMKGMVTEMPYIGTKTTVRITPEKEEILKKRLGEAISAVPGKSEKWLMCEFTDNCRLWFAGDNSKPAAYVNVKVFGGADSHACEKLTGIICDILGEELSVPSDRVYVTYSAFDDWGWNGTNF